MEIFDLTLDVMAKDGRIADVFSRQSEGDRWILENMLDDQSAASWTTKGSANDELWLCLCEHGWMEVVPFDAAMAQIMEEHRQFSITDLGRRAIPVMLCQLYQTVNC